MLSNDHPLEEGFALDQGVNLSGQVVDKETMIGVANARVSVLGPFDGLEENIAHKAFSAVDTGDFGHFAFGGLPDVPLWVMAEPDGYSEHGRMSVNLHSEPLVLKLSKGAEARGFVHANSRSTPLTRVRCHLSGTRLVSTRIPMRRY